MVKISFIIPAHNEELWIGSALKAIMIAAADVVGGYEVIVVSDGSTDSTDRIVNQYGARLVSVNLRNVAAVRNKGASLASGDLLFSSTLILR